ncbi:Per1-like-domain-containing protein [Suillus plorans]|uniref:Post-GPI attachment to proteins factor 3 n=1 Tax=Suillus plorans TaxID=116603 RepID=A0A9P7J233_9AGAM|nr:Per1-like-domain-containing protein [Suillus plorans]KAG1799248.1 Per1-like-domain-containing protein [Suillus plorans]
MLLAYRWVLATLPFLVFVVASSGDRLSNFQNCVSACYGDYCHPQTTLSLGLRLTCWTCTDDCKYQYMHMLTGIAIFWRFFGMQEPASVAFSLWNMYYHIQGWCQLRSKIPSDHPMRSYYLTCTIVSVNAWLWFAVFHTRDLPNTEKLDYFSAALVILYSLYHTVLRLFNQYPTRSREDGHIQRTPVHVLWSSICTVVYLAHVTYLSILPQFDYSYNMAFNLTVGFTHNLLWLLYSLPVSLPLIRHFPFKSKTYRPSYASEVAVFVVLTTAATALELFDFPPWGRIIEGSCLFWYDFLIKYSLDDGWREPKR